MDRYLDLNKDEPLPKGDDGLGDATGDSLGGMSKAEARQGFDTVKVIKGDIVGAGEKEEQDFYSFFDDSPQFGGFAGRPDGYER